MLERWLHRKLIPAVHERDMIEIIKDLGLYEELNSGRLNCSICGSEVTVENIQCIYMRGGKIKFCCSSKSCYEEVLNAGTEE